MIGMLLLVSMQTAFAQTAEEVLNEVRSFYQSLGMTDKVKWLDAERKRGRIRFERLAPDVTAVCDMKTKVITINSVRPFQSHYSYLNLGQTLCHEAVHQGQDYETWKTESWQEWMGQGNRCEQQAWREGFYSIRRMARALKEQARTAPSSRERAAAASRLKDAVDLWQVLANDWHETGRKRYGSLKDEEGLPIDLDAMARERTAMLKLVKDVTVTSAAMTRPFAGRYEGDLTAGSSGRIVFTIRSDHSVVGRVSGKCGTKEFQATIRGGVDADGNLEADLIEGKINLGFTDPPVQDFTGKLQAQIRADGGFHGSWEADWTTGEFRGKRK